MLWVCRSPTCCMYNVQVILANRTKSSVYCQRAHKWILMDWLCCSGDCRRGEGRASVWPRCSSLRADINSYQAMSLLSPPAPADGFVFPAHSFHLCPALNLSREIRGSWWAAERWHFVVKPSAHHVARLKVKCAVMLHIALLKGPTVQTIQFNSSEFSTITTPNVPFGISYW